MSKCLKLFVFSVFAILLTFAFMGKVYAGTGDGGGPYWYVTVDGEKKKVIDENKTDTAEDEFLLDKYHIYRVGRVLKLKNYNGGAIGLSQSLMNKNEPHYIELIGDNYITIDEGVALDFENFGDLHFVGDGTLTIDVQAPKANIGKGYLHVSYDNSYDSSYHGIIKVSSGASYATGMEEDDNLNSKNKETTKTTKAMVKRDNKSHDIFTICIYCYAVFSLILILILIILNIILKKKIKELSK